MASRRLVSAEAALARGDDAGDQVAVEVLGNIAAMESAIALATTTAQFGLDDLLAYVNGDDHSPVVQAALAHAQFETIHPFADGNGRTGRALIHVVLRRRGLAPAFVPPISLVLATWSNSYVTGLMGFRHLAKPQSAERSAAAAEWLRVFATATHRACVDAERYATAIDTMTAGWRQQLGRVRANSSTDLLLQVLPGAPVVSVESASALIGRSKARTTEAVNTLAAAGVQPSCWSVPGRLSGFVDRKSRVLT